MLVDVNNDEVTSLVDLFEDIAFLKNAELTDLSALDEASLVDAMRQMGINRIFNSNVEKSQTKFAGTKRAGLTAHQAVLCDTVYADALRSYFYNDASPKDIAHATDYGTAATKNERIYDKIAYTIGEKIPALSGGLNAAIANYLGKSTPLFLSWQECLHEMKSPTYSEFIAQTKGVNDLTGEEMKGLLHTLNDCVFYRDIVPNALYNALIEDCPFSDVLKGLFQPVRPFRGLHKHGGEAGIDRQPVKASPAKAGGTAEDGPSGRHDEKIAAQQRIRIPQSGPGLFRLLRIAAPRYGEQGLASVFEVHQPEAGSLCLRAETGIVPVRGPENAALEPGDPRVVRGTQDLRPVLPGGFSVFLFQFCPVLHTALTGFCTELFGIQI